VSGVNVIVRVVGGAGAAGGAGVGVGEGAVGDSLFPVLVQAKVPLMSMRMITTCGTNNRLSLRQMDMNI
jgi:hypothetical protein